MRVLLLMACMSLASSLFAQDCVKNARGETVCGNGTTAAAANGVATTTTNTGGEAKTKNGKGVAQGPDGTICAKGKNNQGCKKQ